MGHTFNTSEYKPSKTHELGLQNNFDMVDEILTYETARFKAIKEAALKNKTVCEDKTDFLTLEQAGLENQDFDTVTAQQAKYYYDEA